MLEQLGEISVSEGYNLATGDCVGIIASRDSSCIVDYANNETRPLPIEMNCKITLSNSEDIICGSTTVYNIVNNVKHDIPLEGTISAHVFSNDDENIFLGTNYGGNTLWDINSLSSGPVLTFKSHSVRTSNAAFHPVNDILATVSWDKSILLFDTKSGDLIADIIDAHPFHIKSAAFRNDNYLFTSSNGSQLNAWDIRMPIKRIFSTDIPGVATEMKFAQNGDICTITSLTLCIGRIDENSKKIYTPILEEKTNYNTASLSPSCGTLIWGTSKTLVSYFRTPYASVGARIKSARSVISE